jgi:tetratricopeptide (TPR) repeat protein
MAGVGKTALAVHWAHQVVDRFSDGQLYVNLQGYSAAAPADPLDVLARFLRALGVPAGQVPAELDAAAAMYRSMLAGRQMLILLDNAATSRQVRPLLPGTPGCLVLVTSRGRLSGLTARDGAARITLDALSEAEAVLLLAKILGPARVDAEPDAAAAIVRRCACLPLALRIAAERAMDRPQITLAELAAQLAADHSRLDMLAAADDPETAVRSVFSWSYQALTADAARTFRLLGVHAGPDIDVHAAGALTAATETETRRRLEVLTGMHLLEESGPDRFRFHDLLRAYAAEQAAAEETSADRRSAAVRLLTWYLRTADAAGQHLAPPTRRRPPLGPPPPCCEPLPFTGYQQALAWYDAEHANLVAGIRLAADIGQDDIAWKLAATMWIFFDLRKPWTDWLACASAGLAAARRAGDRSGEFWALQFLSAAYVEVRRFEDALGCCQQAAAICARAGDRQDECAVLNNLGCVYASLERFEDALSSFQKAIGVARQCGDRYTEGIALDSLGQTFRILHQPGQALGCHQMALVIATESADLLGEGIALHNLGAAYQMLGRPGEAREHYLRARAVRQRAGDRKGEAETSRDIGDILHHAGHAEPARQCWSQALAIFDDLGDPQAAQVRDRLTALLIRRPLPRSAGFG